MREGKYPITIAMSLAAPVSHSFLTTDEQNVDLFPLPTELTVAQAAIMLGVSDGYVVELLADDMIEHRQEGARRLINRDELFAYKQKRERRRAECEELMSMFREMGISQ